MTLLDFISNPIVQEIWGGIKYTAPRIARVIQEQMLARPVSEENVQQATAETAAPDFGQPIIEKVIS